MYMVNSWYRDSEQNIHFYQVAYKLLLLPITTLWANSAADKSIIFFLIFPENRKLF